MALIIGIHVLRSYLKLICEYELMAYQIEKLVAQRIMVKTKSKVKPLLVCHILRNHVVNDLIYFLEFLTCSCLSCWCYDAMV